MIEGTMPRLVIVITHRDSGDTPADLMARINTELAKHDVSAEIIPVAPFSDREEIQAGFGLAALMDATAGSDVPSPSFWSASPPKPGARSYLSYRRHK
jgi:hypothetical protein